MSDSLPPNNYLKIVPVEIFCQFWKELGCVPASYLAPAVKVAKHNIYNCATCIVIDTMDFDATILLKLKNLKCVVIKCKWVKNTPLASVLSKLYKNGVDVHFKTKVTPKMLVNCELYGLISIVVPMYTYKQIEELVYEFLNSPKPGVKKCITCIIKLKPQLKQRVNDMVDYAITTEYSKPKPNTTKIKLLKSL